MKKSFINAGLDFEFRSSMCTLLPRVACLKAVSLTVYSKA